MEKELGESLVDSSHRIVEPEVSARFVISAQAQVRYKLYYETTNRIRATWNRGTSGYSSLLLNLLASGIAFIVVVVVIWFCCQLVFRSLSIHYGQSVLS